MVRIGVCLRLALLAIGLLALRPTGHAQAGVLSIRSLYTPLSNVRGFSYSPDGKTLAVGGDDGIQLFSMPSGTFMRSLPIDSVRVYCIAFSPSGTTLACGGIVPDTGDSNYSPLLQLWNVTTGALVSSLSTQTDEVDSVAFSPDGKTLYDSGTGGQFYKGYLESWNLATGKPSVAFDATAFWRINSLAVSRDGKVIVGGGGVTSFGAGLAQTWSTATGKVLTTLKSASNDEVWGVAISPDGGTVADAADIVDADGELPSGLLELWSANSGKLLNTLKDANEPFTAVAFSPNGASISAGGEGSLNSRIYENIYVWSTVAGKLQQTVKPTPGTVTGLGFSPDGKSLLVGGFGPPGVLENYQVATGNLIVALDTSLESTYYEFADFDLSPDGNTVALAGSPLTLWNTKTGGYLGSFAGSATFLAYSRDGVSLALADSSTIQIARVSTQKVTQTINSAASVLTSIKFSRDGKLLVDSGYTVAPGSTAPQSGIVEVWSMPSGKLVHSFPTGGTQPTCVDVSGDDATVAAGSKGYLPGNPHGVVLELWSVSTGKLKYTVPTTNYQLLPAVALSPDGTLLADSGENSPLELWSTSSGTLIRSLASNPSIYPSLTFSADGKILYASTSPTETGIVSSGIAAIDPNTLAFMTNYPQETTSFSVSKLVLSADEQFFGLDPFLYPYFGTWTVTSNPYYGYISASTLTASSKNVLGGTSLTGTVTLAAPAPAQSNIVNVKSSSSSVLPPAFVTVKPGANQANFSIQTHAVTSAAPITVTASSNGTTAKMTLTVTSLINENVPSNLVGGVDSVGVVALTGPAPSGGATITLSSNCPLAVVPASVFIAAGTSFVGFPIKTSPTSSDTSAIITASLEDVTLTKTIVVKAPVLSSISVPSTAVVGGSGTSATVTLTGIAPSGGITATLASSNPAIATLASSVVIPSGQPSVRVPITTFAVGSLTQVTLSATVGSVTKSAALTVSPATLNSVTVIPSKVQGSSSTAVIGEVSLNGPAPTGGLVVNLASSNPSDASVPTTVSFVAGSRKANFTVSHYRVSANVSVTVTATLSSISKTATLTVIP